MPDNAVCKFVLMHIFLRLLCELCVLSCFLNTKDTKVSQRPQRRRLSLVQLLWSTSNLFLCALCVYFVDFVRNFFLTQAAKKTQRYHKIMDFRLPARCCPGPALRFSPLRRVSSSLPAFRAPGLCLPRAARLFGRVFLQDALR